MSDWKDYRVWQWDRMFCVAAQSWATRAAADAACAAEEERLLAEGWGPWLGWGEAEEPTARRGEKR